MPKSSRPPLMMSSIAACSAIRTGWCSVVTFVPCASRIRFVSAAIAVSASSGFGLNSAPSGWKWCSDMK